MAILLLCGLSFLLSYLWLGSSQITRQLREENEALKSQYSVLSRRLDDAMGVMEDIRQRDDNLYRVLLMADPVSSRLREAGYGGTNRYEKFEALESAHLVVGVMQKMDMLMHKLYIQSKSFDEVVEFFKNHEDMLDHLPAIQPISNDDLKHTASGFGWRIDPVYGTRRFHYGMDFSCDIGTPVYATANGRIVSCKWEKGYGTTVEIDHGYGYQTRYCHLSTCKVQRGQQVRRGDLIALSGNSGKSTGPHLHYEVLQKGKKVNPINYYFMDLDADQYAEIVQIAENHGKMFD
jgi:murein DD-endopeptidase MepM/ murein hydrolase activator NlpD